MVDRARDFVGALRVAMRNETCRARHLAHGFEGTPEAHRYKLQKLRGQAQAN